MSMISPESVIEMKNCAFTLGYVHECQESAKAALDRGDHEFAMEMIQAGIDAFNLHRASLAMFPDDIQAVAF